MLQSRINDIIGLAHQRQRDMCARLEALADGLPAIEGTSLGILARDLQDIVTLSLAARRELMAQSRDVTDTAIDRLLREIEEDGQHGEEIVEILGQYAEGLRPICPTALGYLLRGYFSATRRRVFREAEILQRLTEKVPA